MMNPNNITGRLYFMDRGAANIVHPGDGRHLYLVTGVIAVPEETRVKPHHFHDLLILKNSKGQNILKLGKPTPLKQGVNCDYPFAIGSDITQVIVSAKWQI